MSRIPWWVLLILLTVSSEPEQGEGTHLAVRSYGPTPFKTKSQQIGTDEAIRVVRCYACTDCERVTYNTTVKTCPYIGYTKTPMCVTYVEKYKYLSKPRYIRGCASQRGTCADILRTYNNQNGMITLGSCNECEGDMCNGVYRSIPNLVTAFLTIMVTPILAKLILS